MGDPFLPFLLLDSCGGVVSCILIALARCPTAIMSRTITVAAPVRGPPGTGSLGVQRAYVTYACTVAVGAHACGSSWHGNSVALPVRLVLLPCSTGLATPGSSTTFAASQSASNGRHGHQVWQPAACGAAAAAASTVYEACRAINNVQSALRLRVLYSTKKPGSHCQPCGPLVWPFSEAYLELMVTSNHGVMMRRRPVLEDAGTKMINKTHRVYEQLEIDVACGPGLSTVIVHRSVSTTSC